MKINAKLTILLSSIFVITLIVTLLFILQGVISVGWENVDGLLFIIIIPILGTAMMMTAVLIFCKKKIFKPLESLIESFDKVGKGDFFHRIENPTDDEIGKLSSAFNELTENLSTKVYEIRAINIKLDSSHRELESRVQRRTKELSDTVEQLKLEIDERKRAEDNLHVMDLAFQQSIDGVAICDMEGMVRFTNEAWADMHGMPRESLINQHLSVFHSQEQMQKYVFPLLRDVMKEGGKEGEIGHTRSDGKTFPTWMSVTLLKDEEKDESIGMVLIARDITQAKEAENELRTARIEAESANLAKSQFLANMSHEIRTPMNAIIGMTELVMDTELSNEQEDYITTLKGSSESLLNLLNDILDLSKIEVGKLDVEYIEYDFRKCINEVTKHLNVQAQRKELELVYDIDWDIPLSVVGDPGRLRQILTNLIGNSIKFTEKGVVGMKAKVIETIKDASGDHPQMVPGALKLLFSVSDTGIGIPKDKQEVIFDKFTQTDSSITRRFGGTGLGLTISRQLVQLMGGEIWVESPGELKNQGGGGQGSTFSFTLPLRIPKGTTRMAEPANISELKGIRTLIVDDIAINREIFSQMVNRWGMIPECVNCGEDAVDTLNRFSETKEKFQLVLMDIQMPNMSGFDTIAKIRNTESIKDTEIIVLTSGGLKGDGKRCRELGVAAYLKKPIPSSQLLEAILIMKGQRKKVVKNNKLITRFSLNEQRKKLDILVAEDNLVNQKLIRRVLEKRGFTVEIANNGKETVKKWQEKPYDILLMDIQMPEMDGIEATKTIRLKEKERGCTTIPIVALTAHAMKGDRERFLEAGMNSYISKPIKQAELMDAIDKLIYKNS